MSQPAATISVLPSPSQSHTAGAPASWAPRTIGKPGSIVPLAPLKADSVLFSSPMMMSLKPSPLMSATTGLLSEAPDGKVL